MKKLLVIALATLLPTISMARDQIRVVGSSTVFPFVSAAAEEFSGTTGYKSPIVESTGTGGGMKLFCGGVGEKYPDFSNASRQIKKSEIELCKQNGVTDIAEIKIGYDGIVLANSLEGEAIPLTKNLLFLALAKHIEKDGKLIENPYKNWNEIDASLPKEEIRVYGPPPTSGTRDAFVELVMHEACKEFAAFEKAYPEKKARKKACGMVREDGRFIEAGENDNLIIQKLVANPKSLGIFGFSFLEQNEDKIRGNTIGGVEPTFENISSGEYGISRSLFVYAKKQHYAVVQGMQEFVSLLVGEETIGEDGFLTYKGLIPMSEKEREAVVSGLFCEEK